MSYDIHFEAKVEGTNDYIPVGDRFISITSYAGAMIRDVCCSWPSEWNSMKAELLAPLLETGCILLRTKPLDFKCFESSDGLVTVSGTLEFLETVLSNCRRYPFAVVRVNF